MAIFDLVQGQGTLEIESVSLLNAPWHHSSLFYKSLQTTKKKQIQQDSCWSQSSCLFRTFGLFVIGWLIGWMDGVSTRGWSMIGLDGSMIGWMDESMIRWLGYWMDCWMDEWIIVINDWMDQTMDEWIDRLLDGSMIGWLIEGWRWSSWSIEI